MYILGLSAYSHESSCALLKDGEIINLLEEERFNRQKHTWAYPQQAVEAALAMAGITMRDIDHVTFFWKPEREIVGNTIHFFRYFPRSLGLLKGSPHGRDLPFLKRVLLKKRIGRRLQQQFRLSRPVKVHFIEHHLAHAASAFFVSGFEEAAILTVDGRGESTSTLMARGRGNRIEKIQDIKVPHSLGHLYAAVTDYLGFYPFFDEWKVMGMSAYGGDRYVKDFARLIRFQKDGGYRLNLAYFGFHLQGQSRWVSDRFIATFGPRRGPKDPYEQRHYDVAYALQRIVEEAGVHMARHLYERTRLPALCLTGGVALNCLMNKRIVEETPFQDVFIQPVANDAGTSLGSALYHYHAVLGRPRRYVFRSPYLGLAFSNAEIEEALRAKDVAYQKVEDITRVTAERIAQGKIVGWFQGRMEAGPRALGHRSIVVDPTDASMKDRLNARVKKREHFRPFAPSVLEERVFDYFKMPKDHLSPYMILVGDVRQEKKEVIPAVTHADGTARVQTVNKEISPKYWRLIAEFERIKGVPVVLNTSFNENEPIVNTPQEAIECFLRTDFDVLAIGDFLVEKSEG